MDQRGHRTDKSPGADRMRLTVLNRATNTTGGNARLRCQCSCGYRFVTRKSWVESGRIDRCLRCMRQKAAA